MAVVRWTNLICGAALLLAVLGFLLFLPGNIADYAHEPEDVWLTGLWVALLGLLAALCLTNVRRPNKSVGFGWRTLANLAAIILLAALFVLGRDDPAVPPLLVICGLGPFTALVGALRRPEVPQP